MPAGPGESHLTTLFGDVHYYFNDPTSKPQHHRFDRGSYVYLFHSAAQQVGKIEIANHAGTPNQDAFSGFLNAVHIRYSYLQPTLFTFSVDSEADFDQSSWHLPSLDLRNVQKYLHKLHTMDVYLWTEKDAATFLGHLKNVVSPAQLQISNAPAGAKAAEHRDSMSPVVQQLERTAIGSQFPPRAGSTVSAQSFPGPPTPATSIGGVPQAPPQAPQAAPAAYNPAAPSAPEPVAYREKTPPPPDDGSGTGLAHAAKYDNIPQPQYQGGFQQTFSPTASQFPQFNNPASPQPHPSQSPYQQMPPSRHGSVASIPQASAPTPTPSFGPFASSTLTQSPPPMQQAIQQPPNYGQPPTQYASYQQQSIYGAMSAQAGAYGAQQPPTPSAPPAYSGPLQSPGFGPQASFQTLPFQAPPHRDDPTEPVGGFGSYNYSAQQSTAEHNPHGAYTGNMHNQLYRPTEEEAAVAQNKKGFLARKQNIPNGPGQPNATSSFGGTLPNGQPSALEGSFNRLEGKVGKYLNKLDKLW